MRIVFMGTPDFAVPSLDILVKNGYEVVLVVTQPDRPKGRGHQVSCCAVKEFALQKGLSILQPEKIGDEGCVAQLKELKPDLLITCAFGQFLPQRVLDIPPKGTINVHGSLLPRYRGAAPIQWAIINGDKKTGITTMLTVLKMDAGDILLQKEIELDDEITAGQLYDRMSLLGAETLLETLQKLESGNIAPVPQPQCDTCYAQKITRETGLIQWDLPAQQIHNLVRGTNPWPGAYSWFKGERMRVWKTKVINCDNASALPLLSGVNRSLDGDIQPTKDIGFRQQTDVSGSIPSDIRNEPAVAPPPGTILDITRDGFEVQTGNGVLQILELQCDNAKRLTVNQYVCGHLVEKGDRFGTE